MRITPPRSKPVSRKRTSDKFKNDIDHPRNDEYADRGDMNPEPGIDTAVPGAGVIPVFFIERDDIGNGITAVGQVTAVAGAGDHTIVETSSGSTESCGENLDGDLGSGSVRHHVSARPVVVSGLPDGTVVDVQASYHNSGVLRERIMQRNETAVGAASVVVATRYNAGTDGEPQPARFIFADEVGRWHRQSVDLCYHAFDSSIRVESIDSTGIIAKVCQQECTT